MILRMMEILLKGLFTRVLRKSLYYVNLLISLILISFLSTLTISLFFRGPIELIKDFQVTNVRVLKKRHLATAFQDVNYPVDHMPFYIYGTKQELHIDHMLLKSPSIQLSADRVELTLTSGELTSTQRENGVIVHFTEVHEIAMQPFPEIQAFPEFEKHLLPVPLPEKPEKPEKSIFFQHDRKFQVELYNDPMPDPYQSGPGLNNVDKKNPIAKGTIKLPSKDEGLLYIDSFNINSDPVAKKEVENGKIVNRPKMPTFMEFYSKKFDHKDELHWYEEEVE
jgi:hypothetical protein